jgi:PAS domain S-box-containing protein
MSEALHESILDGCKDGVFVAQEGEVIYANEYLQELTGYAADELVERPKTQIVAPEDTSLVNRYHEARLNGDAVPDRQEIALETAEGDRIPVELSASRITHAGDPAVVSICRELTNRDERTRELDQSRERLRVLFDQAPDALVLHDDAGTVLDVNEQTLDYLGYSRDELLSMNVTDFDVAHDLPEFKQLWQELDVGETLKAESRHECKDGSIYPVEMWVSRIEIEGETRYLAMGRDITEQKSREQRIETLKERLELAVNVANLGVWDWDIRTDEVAFNDQWAEMLGFDPADIEPNLQAWEQRVHPDDLPAVNEDLDAHIRGETEYYDTEHRMETADGDWKWIRDVGKVVEYEDGEPVRAVGLHIDIDERKEREQQLQLFRKAVEQTAHAIYITDTDGTIEYINPAFEEITGYDEQDILGEDPSILKTGEHDDELYDQLWDTIEEGERWTNEMIDRRADGEQIVLNQTIAPITDSSGEPQKYVAVANDITDRKEYEEALDRAQEELRQIIDLVPDLIFAKNREGVYLLANKKTAEAYDLSIDEIEGSPEAEVIPDLEDSEQFRKDDLEVIDSGESKFIPEEELTNADGETRILQTTKIPYQVSGTGEDAVLGYGRDITELKEYERELEAQRDNLELLNQIVRHDIRNDLQIVSTYAETLESYVEGQHAEYLSKMLKAARDAIQITEMARDVTEVMLQSGTEPFPVNVQYVLEEEINDVRSNHEQALVTTNGSIPDVSVRADDMLESVFRNLLRNAVQHNDKEIPKVTVTSTTEADRLRVSIADNGPGIPDEQKEEIFREGESGLDNPGTGLGLYLVETLVDRYGGEVHVEDNEPEGAEFVVSLPLAE